MAVELKLRKGTASENDNFTGAIGEVTVDTTNNTLRVHNGSSTGGSVVVTDTAIQTLTNKTLDLTNNTLQTTFDQLDGAVSDATLITEAPQDGNAYVRQNGQWVDINTIVYSSSTAT